MTHLTDKIKGLRPDVLRAEEIERCSVFIAAVYICMFITTKRGLGFATGSGSKRGADHVALPILLRDMPFIEIQFNTPSSEAQTSDIN